MQSLNTTFLPQSEALRDALARSTNIKGALSPLSMNPRRDIEKSLIPLTVSKGQIVKADIESAP
jgi:hypothetical protein